MRYRYVDLTISFSRPAVNPVIQINDLGGVSNTGLGFTSELELLTPPTGVTLSRLSGEAQFLVDATPTVGVPQIRNGNSDPAVAAGLVSGSVLVNTPATGVSSLTFRLYVRANPASAADWHGNPSVNSHAGDLVYLSVSQLTPVADVATSILASANPVLAGQPLRFNVTYTNAGPTTAEAYTQTLQLSAGLGAGNVTFTNLPAGVTAAYDNGSGVVTFSGTPTSLVSGANQNLTVNIATVPVSLTNVTASTTVGTGSYQGADTGANSASINVPVTPVADVATAITASPNPVAVGQPLSFAVTFTNAGPSAAAGYTQTLQLSAGLGAGNVTFANANQQSNVAATYDNNTGKVSFTGVPTSLASGTNQNLTVNIAAVPNTLASVSASTTVGTTANQGNDTGANSATSNVPVQRITDISTTLTGPTSATQGNGVTLNVNTSNLGTVAAFNVAQTVQLVSGLTNVFVSNNGTYNSGNGLVTFPVLSTLSVGQTIGNYVSFAAPATAFAPTAAVTPNTAATGDSNPANNAATLNGATASANITINQPIAGAKVANLYTTVASSVLSAEPGSNVTLTVVTGSNGPSISYNVKESVQLLPDLNTATLKVNNAGFISQSGGNYLFAAGANYNTATGLVTFAALSQLDSGASTTNTIDFIVPALANGQILPTAAVNSTSTDLGQLTVDPVLADNFSATAITVLPKTDLVATISGPTIAVVVNQPVTYTATFINNGPATAINAVATVQLLVGLTEVVTSQGSYNATTGLVTFPVQPSVLAGAGQSYTISFVPPVAGSYTASAAYSSSIVDVVPTNNTASTTASVTPSADLSVKLSGPASVAKGGAITYVAETTNNGPSNAGPVITIIQLPVGLTATTTVTSSSGGIYDNNTGKVTFTTASLANGATVSNYANFAYPATALGAAFTSSAVVNSAATDPVAANNIVDVSTNTVTAAAAQVDLSTTLTGPTAAVVPNSMVTLNVRFASTAFLTNGNPSIAIVERLFLPPNTVVSTVNGVAPSAAYNQATGVLTFAGTSFDKNNLSDTYAVVLTAPATGSFSVISTISSIELETGTASDIITNNKAIIDVITAPVGYDEATTLTGPASALPGSAVTYTVQSLNNGPANSGTVTQVVTLPAGTVVTNNGGGTVGSNGTAVTITFPAVTNQAPGVGSEISNSFTATMPAAGSLLVSVATTATSETGPTANNAASMTTTAANQFSVAAKLVNVLQTPVGNSAGQVGITPLSATDADGSIASFRLNSIPDATNQGILYYDNGGTYTAITPANFAALSLTPAQANTLRFDPVLTFIGNSFFDYMAIDNVGAQSLSALYTIKVGQDNNSVYTLVTRGGNANRYQNGDVVAYGIDPNGAAYNAAGVIYDPAINRTGTRATGTNSGLQSAAITAANTLALTAVGIAFDPATGLFTVVDRTKLPRVGTTVPVTITTADLFGGTNTQAFNLVLGNNPLPVELKEFTATAVKNVDAQLAWTTASEKNNDHFDVERSLTGTSFLKIGQVKGQGNSSSLTEYALIDVGIGAKATGLVYYRLKQVDLDGTTSFSPVRTVAFTNTAVVPAIVIYPNPAAANTQLDLTQLPAGNYQVSILDATGRVVLGTSLSAGSVRTLNLSTIASGAYVVLVRGHNDGKLVNLTKRLIKE